MWVHLSPMSHFDVDLAQMAQCFQHLIIMPVYCLRGVFEAIGNDPLLLAVPSKHKKYINTFLNIKIPCTLYESALPQLKTQSYKIWWLHTKHLKTRLWVTVQHVCYVHAPS